MSSLLKLIDARIGAAQRTAVNANVVGFQTSGRFSDGSVEFSGDSVVFSDARLGTPFPGRFVVIALAGSLGEAPDSVTVSGNGLPETDARRLASLGELGHSSLWLAPLPVGVEADIEVKFPEIQDEGRRLAVATIAVSGLSSVFPFWGGSDWTGAGSDSETSLGANAPAGGATIACHFSRPTSSTEYISIGVRHFGFSVFDYPVAFSVDSNDEVEISGLDKVMSEVIVDDLSSTPGRTSVVGVTLA